MERPDLCCIDIEEELPSKDIIVFFKIITTKFLGVRKRDTNLGTGHRADKRKKTQQANKQTKTKLLWNML